MIYFYLVYPVQQNFWRWFYRLFITQLCGRIARIIPARWTTVIGLTLNLNSTQMIVPELLLILNTVLDDLQPGGCEYRSSIHSVSCNSKLESFSKWGVFEQVATFLSRYAHLGCFRLDRSRQRYTCQYTSYAFTLTTSLSNDSILKS